MKLVIFIFAIALSSEIVLAGSTMSLEQGLNLQDQITISPVQFEGFNVASSKYEPINIPSMICASLGYPRLVQFEAGSEKSIRQLLKEGTQQLAIIESAGSDSEGYSKAHGAYFYSLFDLSEAFFKGQKITTLSSVTCAKSL